MMGKITRNTTYLTCAYIGQKIIALFYFIIIARAIGAADLGKYAFAMSFAALFGVFADMGLSQTLIRETAKNKEHGQNYFSAVFSSKLFLSLITYAILIVTVNLLGYSQLVRTMVYLSGIVMVLDSFILSFWAVFRSQQNLKYEAINIVIYQVIVLATGFCILWLKLGLVYLIVPFIFASAWSAVFSAVLVGKKVGLKFIPKLERAVIKSLMRISIAFALISIFSRVYTYLDSILLSYLAGDSALGYYSAAYKLPAALVFIPSALAAAIFPAFSESFSAAKERLKKIFDESMSSLAILAVPIGIGIAGISGEIILKFYGAEYLPGVEALKILGIAMIFVFLNYPIGALLNACDKQKLNVSLYGATMCVNAALNFLLIPKFSYVGASIAFLISHCLLFLVNLFFARQIINYSCARLFKTLFKTVLSGLIMLAGILTLKMRINILVVTAISAPIYLIVLYLIRGFGKEQIKFIKEMFSRRANVVEQD
ncbi:flippase [Candidatus Falkowbacteria bacterium]|nr:flippase [Candidatus Falkowbacteria bacterium]